MKKALFALTIICFVSCKKKRQENLESGIIKSYVGTMTVTHAGNINQGKSFVWDAKEFDRDGKLLKHTYSFENNWVAADPTRILTDEVEFKYRDAILSSKRSTRYASTTAYTISNGDTLIIDNLTDYRPNYTYETRKHQNGKIVQSTLKRFAGTRASNFSYDSRDFVSKVTGVSEYEPLVFTINYEHDNQGRLLKETEISKWGEIVQRALKYTHDAQGRLVSVTYYVFQAGWRKHNFTDKPYLGYHEIGKDGVTVVKAVAGGSLVAIIKDVGEKVSKKTFANIAELVKDIVAKRSNIRSNIIDLAESKDLARLYAKKIGINDADFEDWFKNNFKTTEKGTVNFHAHHVIPIEILENNDKFKELLFRLQGKADFDFNGIDNGIMLQAKSIGLDIAGHAKHDLYSEAIGKRITEICSDIELDDLTKLKEVKKLISKAKEKLKNEVLLGNKDVNQIVTF